MDPRIELITCLDRFNEIRPQWDALWRRCRGRVFQAHPWISTWLAHDGSAKPYITVAWQNEEILAAIPLVIRRRSGVRTLEWAAQVLSDYCDALATADTASLLPSLWRSVWDAGSFALLNLAQVRPDSVMRPLLEREATDRVRITGRKDTERCLGIKHVWRDSEAWFRSLGKKGRNNFWRGERILADLGGGVEFRCLDSAEQSVDAELRCAMQLKREWLRSKSPGSSLLRHDGEVLTAMLCAAAGQGLLRLFVLYCDDRMVAASVNFVTRETMDAYLTCYDSRWAFDHGIQQIDFMRGDEPFKSHFANHHLYLTQYRGARTFLGKSLLAGHGWYSRLRDRSHPISGIVSEASEVGTANLSSVAGGS
jgi:CelD/BcsL family acetyltransferase involved in cellulose biosynthesis